jgi:hypothetical protein
MKIARRGMRNRRHEQGRTSMPRQADNSARIATDESQVMTREEKPMCPVCLATAALIAGSATSTGGLAAMAIKKFGGMNAADNHPAPTPSGLSRKKNGAGEIDSNSDQRRKQDVNEHD